MSQSAPTSEATLLSQADLDLVPHVFGPNRVSRRCPDATGRDYSVCFVKGKACCGQKRNGPQYAPDLVLGEDFLGCVSALGWQPSTLDAIQQFRPTPKEYTGRVHNSNCVSATCDVVRQRMSEALAKATFAILIGGDHCLSIGSIAATAQRFPNLVVLWFDAHADINTADTSMSGNMHGMPVAALLGLRGMEGIPGFEHARFKAFDKTAIAYIGLRDVDDGEKETIRDLGIETAFYMDTLNALGIDDTLDMCLKKIDPDGNRPIHVSFDVDGMDPMDAPATGTPVQRGVRLHEAVRMMQRIRDTGRLVSLDVMEVNPSLAKTQLEYETTVCNSRIIILEALGRVGKS